MIHGCLKFKKKVLIPNIVLSSRRNYTCPKTKKKNCITDCTSRTTGKKRIGEVTVRC